MYELAALRDFIAQHFLIGGDWGAENHRHSHHYVLELTLQARELDRHGYLIDLVDVEAALEAVVARFRDKLLNECVEFASPPQNPSLERFAKILCELITVDLQRAGHVHLQRVQVKLWEHERAFAIYGQNLNA